MAGKTDRSLGLNSIHKLCFINCPLPSPNPPHAYTQLHTQIQLVLVFQKALLVETAAIFLLSALAVHHLPFTISFMHSLLSLLHSLVRALTVNWDYVLMSQPGDYIFFH